MGVETYLVSEEELRTYQRVIDVLSRVHSMNGAVEHPSQRLMWDYERSACVPGRVWLDRLPPEGLAAVSRRFTPAEVEEVYRRCRMHVAPTPPDGTPRAILIIGPAGAGKSSIRRKAEKFFRADLRNFAELDGHELRMVHGGWAEATADPRVGYKDAWRCQKAAIAELKDRMWREALDKRLNLVLPWTASGVGKTMREYAQLRERGYAVDVLGLVVSFRASRNRMLNRAHITGRYAPVTREKWQNGMVGLLRLAAPDLSGSAVVYDNTDFTSPRLLYSRTGRLADLQACMDRYRALAGLPTSAAADFADPECAHSTPPGSPDGLTPSPAPAAAAAAAAAPR